MMKKLIRGALTATIALALALGVYAQAAPAAPAAPKAGEKTVEEAYLQEAAEMVMVRELSRGEEKDGKILALLYAKRALDGGRKNEEIRSALQYLALENSKVIIRSGGLGASTNNFPDIRAKACEYLGEFPSPATKDTLETVLRNTRIEDPMVLAEAIRSLAKIGANDADEVVGVIANSVNHFAAVGMSEDRLAVYTLFAFSDLADKNHGIKDMATVTSTIMKFTEGSYVGAVKRLALDTLSKISAYSAVGQGK
jgi:hypothetical protein